MAECDILDFDVSDMSFSHHFSDGETGEMEFPHYEERKKRSIPLPIFDGRGPSSSSVLMKYHVTGGYSINEFVSIGILVWIPTLLLSAYVLSVLDPDFTFAESIVYMGMQTLAIGHSKHVRYFSMSVQTTLYVKVSTKQAIAFAFVWGTILVPISVFMAILYSVWWIRALFNKFEIHPLLKVLMIWLPTIGVNYIFLDGESIEMRFYNM